MSGEETSRQAAQRYQGLGLSVIPLKGKTPTGPWQRFQREAMSAEEIDGQKWPGVGIVTGKVSGIVVLDADSTQAVKELARRGHPPTPIAKTARGKHLYFKHPGGELSTRIGLGDALDLKGDGGYVAAPPSRHPTGAAYEWLITPEEAGFAELPGWALERIKRRQRNGHASPIGEQIPGGRRNRELFSIAGSMRRRGLNEAEILGALKVTNEQRCRPPLEAEEVAKIASSASRYDPAPLAPPKPSTNGAGHDKPPERKGQPPTHDELRDRWIAGKPDRAHGLGEWRIYEGGTWSPASDTAIKAEIAAEIERAKPEGIKPTASTLASVTELARVKAYVTDERWDANPDVQVCTNGALNLTTRELMPHAKGYYATAGVPYAYRAGERCEAWEHRVMGELVSEHLGAEAAAFLQEFAGYALTTNTEHEIALWLTGKHGGGRSTVLAGLGAMLGPRAGVLSLMDIERSTFALTNLPGKTLVTATEQPAVYLRGGGALNAIISGEPLQVDRKYRDPITVVPRCKIAWAMNELPRVGNVDDGIFRRVKVLVLPEIAPAKRDPRVKEEVKAGGAGILNWALDGLDRLKARGRFEVPASISSATEEFKEHNDVPALFLEEACQVDEGRSETGANLYGVYKGWCLDNGHKPLASNNAAREWKRLGLERKRTPKGVRWHGAGITDEAMRKHGSGL